MTDPYQSINKYTKAGLIEQTLSNYRKIGSSTSNKLLIIPNCSTSEAIALYFKFRTKIVLRFIIHGYKHEITEEIGGNVRLLNIDRLRSKQDEGESYESAKDSNSFLLNISIKYKDTVALHRDFLNRKSKVHRMRGATAEQKLRMLAAMGEHVDEMCEVVEKVKKEGGDITDAAKEAHNWFAWKMTEKINSEDDEEMLYDGKINSGDIRQAR